MANATTQSSPGSVRGTLLVVLVLVLAAGGLATWRYDLLGGRWDALSGSAEPLGTPADPRNDPVEVAPPPGLDLPPVARPAPVAQPASTGGVLDPDAVRRALAPYLRDPDLGRHVRALVAPVGGGPAVFSSGTAPAIPASTTKLVTGIAALLSWGPEHVFSTTTRLSPAARGARRLTLVGGGDPFLERTPRTSEGEDWPYPARADVTTLAALTATDLRAEGVRRVRLAYDDTLFTGPAINPTWEDDYPYEVVSPTSALWVDEGRTISRFDRVPDPAAEAAAAFAGALRGNGIAVVGDPGRAAAPARSRQVAQVDSAPLGEIVQRIVEVSDNEASEVLLRHVGLAGQGEGSSIAGKREVRSLLRAEGVRFGSSTFFDGSGLSRANRSEPALLLAVLRLAAAPTRPELRAVVEGLPVAGFTGSLSLRMDEGPPAGLGRVRAKTGTLKSVSSLAGIGTDLSGTVFAFVLMADRVAETDTDEARTALDSAAAALGACECSR